MKPIVVGLDRALLSWIPEIKYVFRTLLRVAGYPYAFVWADESNLPLDIYYGIDFKKKSAPLRIVAGNKHFTGTPWFTPDGYYEQEGLPFLDFGEGAGRGYETGADGILFYNDIIFSSFWLLTGGHEESATRDRWDNLHLDGALFVEQDLASKPLVSLYGRFLRTFLQRYGHTPLNLPWAATPGRAAFAISHDVDYPEIIPWIESLRALRQQGVSGLATVGKIARGRSHFWKFAEWVEFAKSWGTRPAFYFMARQGSLPQYALGTPDAFYDINRPPFRRLFSYLQQEGCEIGLHASYKAYRSAAQLRREKERLEEATGTAVAGNRHHYWHLDPAAPYETLRAHEQIGLDYDSSLAYDFYPGFRRGICHPFHVFHPGEGRELDILQLPPAWMDDHFDQRLPKNGITDPAAYACRLVEAARWTDGIVLLDYHVRGMNNDFFPRYGAWLQDFFQANLGSHEAFHTPAEIAQLYRRYEQELAAYSRDETVATATAPKLAAPTAASSVTVHALDKRAEKEWNCFADGSFYHTLSWRDVTVDGLGHRPHYLYSRNAAGEINGVLPLFLVKGLFGKRLVSLPMRDRGSLLTRDRSAAAALLGEAIELTRSLDCRYLELRSFAGMDPELSARLGLRSRRQWTTTRIDLTIGVDKLWNRLEKKSIRWAIKKSRKQGVHFEVDNSLAGIETFYQIFVRTRSEMGIPPFPKQLFTAIYRHLIVQGKANLFVLRKEEEPIHAMINFFSGDVFVPAYAAPQNAFRKLYPSELMFWSTIEWAANHGFRYLDFGADSPRQMGLLFFKRKWGGVHYPMTYTYYLNRVDAPPDFDSSSPAYELMRKAWSYLPEPVCRHLGSWVTRQLS